MSVESSELMSDVWTRWQGYVIHEVFPLGRCVGCSDHSGVFLSKSAALGPSEVAVKLVPADRALAESHLPRWKRAGGIAHPHLLRLLQWGGCQLDGLPFLYVVMEYADQTLAQVLQHRALTDDEAREMLRPTLDALAFLHGRNLVHGQLKPANILGVGDQLKLASDTIRRVGEGTMSAKSPTGYVSPEARHGSSSTAGDIWALGACLFEALTRHPPSGSDERSEAVALPADFSPAFRDVVARCLNPNPQSRPSVTEFVAWARGQAARSAPDATVQPTAIGPLEPTTPEPAPPRITLPPAAPEAARPTPSLAKSPNSRALLSAALGTVLILALGWTGIRIVSSHRTPAPSPPTESSLSQSPSAAAPVVADVSEPTPTVALRQPSRSDLTASPSALHDVIPEVPQSAQRTISGHIIVWVRVIVDQDGSVFAATADRIGPSLYFQRLAIEAAKKWTFPPIDTQSRRVMQIRFDFSRDGTTGRMVTLH
jgi:serine/threonine protein kinase